MANRVPKFCDGQVVRVIEPDAFLAEFGRKIANRVAVVLANLLNFDRSGMKQFNGRVKVEFQKRNGRGKVFVEIMNERHLIAADVK